MNYVDFFEKLRKADSRNEYSVIHNCEENCLKELPDFYKEINPLDVEFEFNDGIVRLVPFQELLEINNLYSFANGCVFATCNGEPIYVRNKKVFTCVVGKNKYLEEELAVSVDSMFLKVMQNYI